MKLLYFNLSVFLLCDIVMFTWTKDLSNFSITEELIKNKTAFFRKISFITDTHSSFLDTIHFYSE